VIGDFRDRTALVTGGTMGIGLETALDLAERGARCAVTYKWGTADEDEVYRRFSDRRASKPLIIRADIGNADDTTALMEELRREWERVDIFVNNASVALVVKDVKDYSLKTFSKAMEYTAWPLFAYVNQIREYFGGYPRYVIAMSSRGPDSYAKGYDFVASAKAALETMCRYMSYRFMTRTYGSMSFERGRFGQCRSGIPSVISRNSHASSCATNFTLMQRRFPTASLRCAAACWTACAARYSRWTAVRLSWMTSCVFTTTGNVSVCEAS